METETVKIETRKNKKAGKRKKRIKIMLWVLFGYLAIMLIGYLGVSYYFSSHFFDRTIINGTDSSKKTIDEVKGDIVKKIDSYSLKITLRGGGTETIKATDVKLSYVDDRRVDQLMEEQEQYKWILSFSDDNKYEFAAGTSYTPELVAPVMKEMSCFQEGNIQKPENAYIEDTGKKYKIIPEVEGNELNWEKAEAAVIEALDMGKTEISFEELECYEKPKVYRDNKTLKKKVKNLNRITATDLIYDFGDERTEVINRATVQDWMIEGKKGEYSIDKDKATAFVADMAKKYDTFGLRREFKTYHGSTISLTGGDYGWCINKAATVDALIAAIEQGTKETIEPVWLYSAKHKGVNDIGSNYVEISIAEQRMWCYKDGKLITDTPVVTGNPSKGNGTPSGGCWAIDAKMRNTRLVGEGYNSAVSYWMPFNGNVGIHDADRWRSSYGGNIYLTSGSHGCVNTPFGNAQRIFENVEIGTPVIVY